MYKFTLNDLNDFYLYYFQIICINFILFIIIIKPFFYIHDTVFDIFLTCD